MAWIQVLTIIASVAGIVWMMTVMINKRIDDKVTAVNNRIDDRTGSIETLLKELIAVTNKRIDDNKDQISELRKA